MGKISKKYIGDDQVGSVQIELENALSLRAKSQDGLSSVDLLEYSSANQMVVQQNLYMADNTNFLSLAELGDTFIIKTDNSAAISTLTNDLASGNTGSISLVSGNAADGNSGSIYLTAGTASNVRGDIIGSAFTTDFFTASFSVKPAAGGATAFNIYDNSYNDSVTISKVSTDFVMKSSLPFFVQTNDINDAGNASKEIKLESGSNDDAGGSGLVSILSGDCVTGSSGKILIQTGAGSNSSNRGEVELDGVQIVLSAVSGNPVQMNFEGGNSSSIAFSNALLGEVDRSLGIQYVNGGSVSSFAINGYTVPDGAAGLVQIIGTKLYKSADGAATSGAVSVSSSADLALVIATNAEISSGDVTISSGDAQVKGTGANASSGDIIIETGSKEGTGTRGSITLDALEVQCSAMQFKNAADPTLAQDLATKAYVDSQIAAGTTCHKEEITLDATDISNQYVDLQEQMIPESLVIGVGARVNLYETLDYTVSVVGGVTRLTFAGPSATGGAEALVLDDKLYITGIVDISP